MPLINGTLQSCNIASFIVTITVWCILGNDGIDRISTPVRYVEVANKLKPGLKALLPRIEDSISTIFLQAAILRDAAHIAQRKRNSRHAGRAEQALMHKEGQ